MMTVFDFAPVHWNTSTRLVALVIADHVGDSNNQCHPSVRRIATRSGLSVRQVQREIRILEAEGVLQVIPRFDNNRQTSNAYLWITSALLSGTGDIGDMGEGDTHVTPRGDTHVRDGGDIDVIQNHHKNPQLNPHK